MAQFARFATTFIALYLFLLTQLVVVPADDLPAGVSNSQNPADVSLTPEQSLKRITVPDGFNVSLFAGEPDIRRPIAFDFDDRGRLWVVENYSHPKWKEDNATDRVVILEDEDNDGQFDKRTVFWDKGRYLTAIAWGHGGIWLGNTPELCFIPDRDGDDVPDGPPVVKLDGFQISTNNVINNVHWGPDGWLYGAIGLSSKSLVGRPGATEKDRVQITRGIWRYHPYSERFEKLAEGMVNPWGADFNEYGDLITANTVLAHIWHIVPGMYCERRANERDNPFAYSRIQTIANHLHWGGGQWQTSRNPSSRRQKKGQSSSAADHDDEYHQHSVAGGGHAHCGAMIYLGTNWPEEYRGMFFTNNLHGNRVNSEKIMPSRSTYVAEHAEDFLFGNDPWFRGMSIKYGPDGGVYISDWHDYGECHDSDGSHRTSGRIYKVTYGKPGKPDLRLADQSSLELAKMSRHQNEWLVRRALRLLQERTIAGEEMTEVRKYLYEQLKDSTDEVSQLRSVWMLHALDTRDLCRTLRCRTSKNEHLRRWTLRLYGDRYKFDAGTAGTTNALPMDERSLRYVSSIAREDSSKKVRLEFASLLQRMEIEQRHDVAEALASHATDANDPYIPLMIWYGYAPAVEGNVDRAIKVALNCRIPLIREYISRRIAELGPEALEKLMAAALQETNALRRLSMLKGITGTLETSGGVDAPASWSRLFGELREANRSELRSIGIRLAVLFGDKDVIRSMQEQLLDGSETVELRRNTLSSLSRIDGGLPTRLIQSLVSEHPSLRDEALTALLTQNDRSTAEFLIDQFAGFTDQQKRAAVAVMVTRRSFAKVLLGAVTAGIVTKQDVSPFSLQQLRSFPDAGITKAIDSIWKAGDASVQKSDEIIRLTSMMTAEHLASGSAARGRVVFDRTCSKCHRLFGEGGSIAPDLTGSGRKKADYVIRNLVDPSAEIDAAYRLTTVITTDGRLFTGFIVKQDDSNIVVRTQDTTVRLKMNDVEELSTSDVSMMPEGMLKTFSDEEFRDLLVYLAGEEQVAGQE